MKKVIMYLRSATRNKSSVREQANQILEYLVHPGDLGERWEECMENPLQVNVFTDNGVGGLSSLEDRPAGRKLIEYCASHPQPASNPGVVAIADQDRLGRFDVTVHARLHQRLGRHGWKVHNASAVFMEGRDHHDAVIEFAALVDDVGFDGERLVTAVKKWTDLTV